MTSPARYPMIEVSGPPRELGRQIGEAARDEIRAFCAIALECVNKTVRISRTSAMEVAGACITLAEQYRPDMMAELRGTAEAARLAVEDLMLLQIRNQLQSESDAGCTSLALAGTATATDGGLVAQNWDNDPALDPFTIVVTRRPVGKPAFMTVTQAGLIAYIGFNDAGLGVCLNTLPAPSRRLGVPHYFTIRAIYEADSLDGAVAAVRGARRAIPANVLLSTPQGPSDLEVTIDDVHVLHADCSGRLTHTNHCRHPELLAINDEFPELIQSYARLEMIDVLLGLDEGSMTVDRIQQALRDHSGYPRSICRHDNDDPQHGFWRTVFSVVIEPRARRMHISRGTPCDHPYETYQMA
jgi:isopenicillin-N N-acyltransferase-like protein